MNITLNIVFQPEVLEALKAFTKGVEVGLANGEAAAAADNAVKPPAPKKDDKPANNLKSVKKEEPKNGNIPSEEESGSEDSDLTIEQVREMVQSKIQLGDDQKAKVKGLLNEFQVKSVSNLDVKQFPAFVQKLKAVS